MGKAESNTNPDETRTVGSQPDDAEQEDIIMTFSDLLKHEFNPPHSKSKPLVLDFGCGYQRMKKYFTDWEYTGVDSNPRVNPPLQVKRGTCIPFLQQSFHLTISVTTLMHNTPKQAIAAINEITRVTQKYVLIIEARRKPRFAYVHNYQLMFAENDFEQILNLRLVTPRSPLAVWIFRRVENGIKAP